MKTHWTAWLGGGLCGALIAGDAPVGLAAGAAPPRYEAFCLMMPVGRVAQGFVRDTGRQTERVDGLTTFTFTKAGSSSRPPVVVRGDALVAPGETALAAWASLQVVLDDGETCGYNVDGSVRAIGAPPRRR